MEVDNTNKVSFAAMDPPNRILLGPGPSNSDPRVLKALSNYTNGHLDPYLVGKMEEIKVMMRYLWQTSNEVIYPVSGTGTAAMDCALSNLVESGDSVLVAINGYFGVRLHDMAQRYGGKTNRIDKTWGEAFTLDELRTAFEQYKPKIFCCVHAETSTGVLQNVEGISDLCKEYDTIWVLDTVTSLGCVPVFLDKWGVDVAYSGSQKGLSCIPGASPITFNQRAMDKIKSRKTAIPCFYLDGDLLSQYWAKENKIYHHTASSNILNGFHEAIRLIIQEGLENVWKRHQTNSQLFWDGLEAMGLQCHVDKSIRLPPLTTVRIPEGIDGLDLIKRLREEYNVEISGGLGELKGKVLRIGLMGYNSKKENVELLLSALKKLLSK